jgi:hypothetical protein
MVYRAVGARSVAPGQVGAATLGNGSPTTPYQGITDAMKPRRRSGAAGDGTTVQNPSV